MSEWQTIDTAPTNGVRIIGLGVNLYGEPHISITSKDRYGRWLNESEVDSDGYGGVFPGDWQPTHWMPLPAFIDA